MTELNVKITLDEALQGLIEKGDIDPIIEEIKFNTIEKFLHNAMHAPSSPITPKKAGELSAWFQRAKKSGMEF